VGLISFSSFVSTVIILRLARLILPLTLRFHEVTAFDNIIKFFKKESFSELEIMHFNEVAR